jgi:hypothetical protein
MASTALGRVFAGRDVQQGAVLMLVGENPDDVRMRWMALAEQMGFDEEEIPVTFMPGVFSVANSFARIWKAADDAGGFALVVVDTSSAYFEGDEENSNKQLGDHARALRKLTDLPGSPCVLVNCHPTKSVTTHDALLPRGGGAYIAEMDGNLTAWKEDGTVKVHWAGKFRGPDFEPLFFEMVTVTTRRLVNSKGRQMPTVIAKPLTEMDQKVRTDAADQDKQRLLRVMADHPGASMSDLAKQAGWFGRSGAPNKAKVQRLLADVSSQKLVQKELNTYVLTVAGSKAAKRHAKCS